MSAPGMLTNEFYLLGKMPSMIFLFTIYGEEGPNERTPLKAQIKSVWRELKGQAKLHLKDF